MLNTLSAAMPTSAAKRLTWMRAAAPLVVSLAPVLPLLVPVPPVFPPPSPGTADVLGVPVITVVVGSRIQETTALNVD